MSWGVVRITSTASSAWTDPASYARETGPCRRSLNTHDERAAVTLPATSRRFDGHLLSAVFSPERPPVCERSTCAYRVARWTNARERPNVGMHAHRDGARVAEARGEPVATVHTHGGIYYSTCVDHSSARRASGPVGERRMMGPVHFMSTVVGRALGVLIGAGLIVVGFATGGEWTTLSVIGVVPLLAGVINICPLALILGPLIKEH